MRLLRSPYPSYPLLPSGSSNRRVGVQHPCRSTTSVLPSSPRDAGRAQFPHSLSCLLSPFRPRVSSLPPSARANHVLLSLSPLSGARVRCATVRNSCCAYATNRRPPQRLCLLFLLTPTNGALRLSLVRRAGRSCCASLACSLACPLVLRAARLLARAARALRAPSTGVFPHPCPIYYLACGRDRFHYSVIAASLFVGRARPALRVSFRPP